MSWDARQDSPNLGGSDDDNDIARDTNLRRTEVTTKSLAAKMPASRGTRWSPSMGSARRGQTWAVEGTPAPLNSTCLGALVMPALPALDRARQWARTSGTLETTSPPRAITGSASRHAGRTDCPLRARAATTSAAQIDGGTPT